MPPFQTTVWIIYSDKLTKIKIYSLKHSQSSAQYHIKVICSDKLSRLKFIVLSTLNNVMLCWINGLSGKDKEHSFGKIIYSLSEKKQHFSFERIAFIVMKLFTLLMVWMRIMAIFFQTVYEFKRCSFIRIGEIKRANLSQQY